MGRRGLRREHNGGLSSYQRNLFILNAHRRVWYCFWLDDGASCHAWWSAWKFMEFNLEKRVQAIRMYDDKEMICLIGGDKDRRWRGKKRRWRNINCLLWRNRLARSILGRLNYFRTTYRYCFFIHSTFLKTTLGQPFVFPAKVGAQRGERDQTRLRRTLHFGNKVKSGMKTRTSDGAVALNELLIATTICTRRVSVHFYGLEGTGVWVKRKAKLEIMSIVAMNLITKTGTKGAKRAV